MCHEVIKTPVNVNLSLNMTLRFPKDQKLENFVKKLFELLKGYKSSLMLFESHRSSEKRFFVSLFLAVM